MSTYKGLRDYIYAIAAVIYVGGMFPLLYLYQTYPTERYQIIPGFTIISVAAAFLLFGQFFVAAWMAPTKQKKEHEPTT